MYNPLSFLSSLSFYSNKKNVTLRITYQVLTLIISYVISTSAFAQTNTAPTISNIGDKLIFVNTSLTIPFSISDAETPVANLRVFKSGGGSTFSSPISYTFSGTGNNRTLTITPASNDTGRVSVSVVVQDAGGKTAWTSFVFTVQANTNTPPTITSIVDRTITQGGSAVIPFSINDAETPSGELRVFKSGGGSTFHTEPTYVFSGAGNSRTLKITPASNDFGSVSLTVVVQDSEGRTAWTTFKFTVNSKPTINDPADVTLFETQNVIDIPFVITDVETPVSILNVSLSTNSSTFSSTPSFTFIGNSSSRVLRVTRQPNDSGTINATIIVRDQNNATDFTTIKITGLLASPPSDINPARSLFIRDLNTLESSRLDLDLGTVLDQLATQLNAINSTDPVSAESLFARLWDTQNPVGQSFVNEGIKCTGSVNGFNATCRPAEGQQAANPAISLNNYSPIALVNRFDLRDQTTFGNCGEARIVYAKTSGGGRNYVIFEAKLPNPTPGNASGCRPIAEFWAFLTDDNDADSRAAKLNDFFINGLSNFGPVIDVNNFAQNSGQIRTNMFMDTSAWILSEFKIAQANGDSVFLPVSVKSNPFGELFSGNRTDSLADQFRDDFIDNMDALLLDTDSFFLHVASDTHNNAQSHASGARRGENNFLNFASNSSSNSVFRSQIQAKLNASSSNLTVNQVLNRATAMTCAGCHNPQAFSLTGANSIGPGVSWPVSVDFVHVSEQSINGNFRISPALSTTFIPAREEDLEGFLLNANRTSSTTSATGVKKTSVPVLSGGRSG